MAGTNTFLVFNEANDPDHTMSDADYLADTYRMNGLIPMISDPVAHNKMYRQWSIMAAALGGVISDANYNAEDSSLSDLKTSLKSTIEDVAEAKVDTRLTTLETWKGDITATPAEINILDGATLDTAELNVLDGITATTSELNILDGVTATASEINVLDGLTSSTSELNILTGATVTTTELNYLSGAESNIQNQINSISGSLATPFPAWIKNTAYSVGDICICQGFDSYKYLECVEAGTSDATPPANTAVGQMITDNSVKWLVCDWRDSAPVGSFRSDMVTRAGWLKANGSTVNRADYPRLWSYAVANSLTTNDPTNNPGLFGEGDGTATFELPNFDDYFVRYSFTRTAGSLQLSQMASHTHSCGNQSASHKHSIGNQSANHTHSFNSFAAGLQVGGNAVAVLGGSGVTATGGISASHTHTLGNQDTSHNHTIGSTGSGSNTYPDNITMQIYIKY